MIRGSQLAEGAITSRELGSLAVGSGNIGDEQIISRHFGSGCLPDDAVPTGLVTNRMLGNSIVLPANLHSSLLAYIQAQVGSGTELPGNPYELFTNTTAIQYKITGDANHYYGAVSKFYDPSVSLAWTSAAQPITVTPGTQHQCYFVKDLIITDTTGWARVTTKAEGMYFVFSREFRGKIWIEGTEVFSNLLSDDTNSQYARADGTYVVNVPGAHEYLTADGITTNRVAILWKLDSGDAQFSFQCAFGLVYDGEFVHGKQSQVNNWTVDDLDDGTSYVKLATALNNYLTAISTAIPSGEFDFWTDAYAAYSASGENIPWPTFSEVSAMGFALSTDLTAANITYPTTGTGFSGLGASTTVKAALDYLSSTSGAEVIGFDLTDLDLYSSASGDPENVQGILALLGDAYTYRFDNINFSGVTNLRDALVHLKDSDNIDYDNSVSIPGSPTTVEEALDALASTDGITLSSAVGGQTNLQDALEYLATLARAASNITYTSVIDSGSYNLQVMIGAIEAAVFESGLPYTGPSNLATINSYLVTAGYSGFSAPQYVRTALGQLYTLFERMFGILGSITGGSFGDQANILNYTGKDITGTSMPAYSSHKVLTDDDDLTTSLGALDAVALRAVDYVPLADTASGELGDFYLGSGEPTDYLYFRTDEKWIRWEVETDW